MITPLQNLLGTVTLGTVNLGLAGSLANAAAGAPITLNTLDVNGNVINLATSPECVTQSDAFELETPGGLALGGNRITGLGTAGQLANARELNAIAFGNLASTATGATGAVAIGASASVTHVGVLGSVALGQNSLATGATLGTQAYLVGGTAPAEVNIGGRRLTGLAAGGADDDGVTVAQLRAASTALAGDSLMFDAGLNAYSAQRGGTATRIANVAAGAVAPGSTDAVNGAQLDATNTLVAGNTTNIANLNTSVTGLQSDALLYDTALGAYSAQRGGAVQRVTNVAAGAVGAGSTDAVNGGQLDATNTLVAGNTTNIANLGANVTNLNTSVTGLQSDALLYDTGLGAYSANRAGVAQRITNVVAGTLAPGSTDAVNGAQLDATNTLVAGNTTNIANLGAGVAGLRTDALLYDTGLGAYSANRAGVAQKVTNVVAGTLAPDSTDAVNGAQLDATNTNVSNLGATITGLQGDALRFDTALNAYSAQRGGIVQRVTNVAAGAVAAGSTDAVNGAQLDATNALVAGNTSTITNLGNSVVAGFGGGAAYDPVTGAVTGPSYVVGGATYTNVGDALTGLSGTVAQAADASVTYDNPATKDRVTLAGPAGTTLANMAAGAVTAGSTEAVNGAQLFATNQQVTANTAAITNVTNNLVGSTVSPVQYSNPATPTQSNGGIITNDVTLIGATPGSTVALHNVAAGSLAAGSTDAVNGGQVATIAAAAGNSLQYDANFDGSRSNVATLAGGVATAPVRIANLANGAVSAASTDAVNGRQLFGVSQTAANAQTSADQALALGRNSVQYDTGGTSVSLAGLTGAPVTIRNVAAGISPTDAVNISQLGAGVDRAIASSNAYTDNRIADVSYNLAKDRRDASGGTAAAMALATIPQAYGPGMGMAGMGISTWRGESAIAFGISKANADGTVVIKAGATYNTRGNGGGAAGIGFGF